VRAVGCLITNRERLKTPGVDGLVHQVTSAAAAGIDLVQVRERDLDGGPLVEIVRRIVVAVKGTNTRVLVNDRVDVALAAAAHGVHLRGDSFAAARVRPFVPAGFLIGRSVHSVAEAADVSRAGGLDYLLFGPVFPSASKPGVRAAGLDRLSQVAAATPLPVLAVGGMTAHRIPEVLRAGAAGFAAIGMFQG
jgi:thiamine-phosphate diphosphorylase